MLSYCPSFTNFDTIFNENWVVWGAHNVLIRAQMQNILLNGQHLTISSYRSGSATCCDETGSGTSKHCFAFILVTVTWGISAPPTSHAVPILQIGISIQTKLYYNQYYIPEFGIIAYKAIWYHCMILLVFVKFMVYNRCQRQFLLMVWFFIVTSACAINTYKNSEKTCLPCPEHSSTDSPGQMREGCVCDLGFYGPPGGPCLGRCIALNTVSVEFCEET